MPRQHVLAEATWAEIRTADPPAAVAVLPWGATEPHNLHLPYGTDNIHSSYIAIEAGRLAWEKGARVIVLPTVPFGVNTGQLGAAMTINMNPSTQMHVLADVTESLGHHGVPKLVVLNGHGGNDFRQMIREVQHTFPDVFLCTVDWYRAAPWDQFFDDLGDHAGEMETSVMMHVAPDLVRPLSEAGSGAARRLALPGFKEKWAWAPRDWALVTSDTGVGNPKAATPDKGRRYVDVVTAKIADFLAGLARADRADLYE